MTSFILSYPIFFQYNSEMAVYEIKTLSQLDPDRFQELAAGYTSSEKYRVTKTETDGQTAITLELQALVQTYVKYWAPDHETETHYREILPQGLSLGLYDGKKIKRDRRR